MATNPGKFHKTAMKMAMKTAFGKSKMASGNLNGDDDGVTAYGK